MTREQEIVDSLLADGLLVVGKDPTLQKTYHGFAFPMILSPAQKSTFKSFSELQRWLTSNKQKVSDAIFAFGAVLFRDFDVLASPVEFDSFVEALGIKPLPYVGGAAPRRVVHGNVFTSNESPPDQPIPPHHEMAQVPKYPTTIYFWAELPATKGGATPLYRSDIVYESVKAKHPQFIAKLESKGLIYTRVLPDIDDPQSPIGRSWRSTFLTDDRAEAEVKAKELGLTLKWLPDGNVASVSGVLPAVKKHPMHPVRTVFFNSMVAAYTGWRDSRNDPKNAVKFGDGSLLDSAVIEDIAHMMDTEHACDLLWKKNDLVCIDNNLVMHSRRTFEGPRRLLAYLGT